MHTHDNTSQTFDCQDDSCTTSTDSANSNGSSNDRVFSTQFTALNNSGVQGAAILTLNDHALTVDIMATGLEADQTHIQHIHGFTDDTDSTSPTILQDTDRDGFVELAEGLPNYGPVLLNLTSPPTDAGDAGNGTFGGSPSLNTFPTAPDGEIRFHQTYTFDSEDDAAQALFETIQDFDNKEIVIHGQTVALGSGDGTTGEVDGTAGYKVALPVAAGEIGEVTGADKVAALARLEQWNNEMGADDADQSMAADLGTHDHGDHSMGHSHA